MYVISFSRVNILMCELYPETHSTGSMTRPRKQNSRKAGKVMYIWLTAYPANTNKNVIFFNVFFLQSSGHFFHLKLFFSPNYSLSLCPIFRNKVFISWTCISFYPVTSHSESQRTELVIGFLCEIQTIHTIKS